MTGHPPMTEKTCSTCMHEKKLNNVLPCSRCERASKYDVLLWEPKPLDPPTDEIACLNRRVADLLAANNHYLERARRAEEDSRFQRMQIIHLVGAIGADALIAVVDDNVKLRAKLAEVSGSRPRRRWRPYV